MDEAQTAKSSESEQEKKEEEYEEYQVEIVQPYGLKFVKGRDGGTYTCTVYIHIYHIYVCNRHSLTNNGGIQTE